MKLIYERLEKLGSDMFISNYAGDIVNLLVNKPKAYRFLYDAQADLYMICDAWDYIHMDMIERAFKDGWYVTQKDFIDEFVCDWFNGCYKYYFDTAVNLGIEFDEDDERDFSLINCDYDDSFVSPWIYCFGFVPTDAYEKDEADKAMTDDGYENSYKFSFGTVYTRNFDLSECDEMRTALNRADR